MTRILLLSAVLGLLLTGISQADTPALGKEPAKKESAKKEPGKPIVVPFELLASGHMAVQVKVNGKGPYRLIFDTGAPTVLVNNKVAREAGLLDGVARPAFTVFGSMGEVKIKKLEVGDQSAEDVLAIVMDHPTVELISRVLGPIHGIVGFPFFARFKMTLDYEAKTVTLEPSDYKPPDVMKAMVAALTATGRGPIALAPAGQWGLVPSKEVGDEAYGVDIRTVIPGSAAARGGLKRGDRLLTLDGRWTDSVKDVFEAAAAIKPGTTVVLKIKRGGKEMSLNVTPAAGM
jgi:hypothetical protein